MSIELQLYCFHGRDIRISIDENGRPWFVLADLCRVLGSRNPSNVANRLPEDEKGIDKVSTLGGIQKMITVNEAGLYTFLLRSNSPQAEPFRRWVTHEVLPAIRRHGMYATPSTVEAMLNDPDAMIQTLQALKVERETRRSLEARAELDAPKVEFADALLSSPDCISVARLANLLKVNGLDVGGTRLFEWMRLDGYLCRVPGREWNRPTQRALELGVLVVKEREYDHNGETRLSFTPMVTVKGQQYFLAKYLGKKETKSE